MRELSPRAAVGGREEEAVHPGPTPGPPRRALLALRNPQLTLNGSTAFQISGRSQTLCVLV